MYRVSYIIILLLAANLRASAQEQADDVHIVTAAAKHFAAILGDSTIAVDPRIAARAHRTASGTFEGEWPVEVINVLRTRLNARAAHQVDVVRCASRSPGSCRIDGVDIFMKLGKPQISDGMATVYVDIMFATGSKRTPVSARQHKLVLEFVRGAWRVVSDKIVAQR